MPLSSFWRGPAVRRVYRFAHPHARRDSRDSGDRTKTAAGFFPWARPPISQKIAPWREDRNPRLKAPAFPVHPPGFRQYPSREEQFPPPPPQPLVSTPPHPPSPPTN